MFNTKFLKLFVFFTLASILLGIASAISPSVASVGWLVGTAISTLGGLFYGRQAETRGQAAFGGAIIGGGSIAIGCALAFFIRAMPIEGVFGASVVGVLSGCVASILMRFYVRRELKVVL
jgi:hypothetical protein